jgi:hypothetical protein
MKYIYFFTILLFSSGFLYAQKYQEIDSLIINEYTVDGHKFTFAIVRDKFDTTKHDISKINDNKIDGKIIYGTDCSIPKTEIKYISIIIDNEEISIDPKLYKNFYNPNIGYVDGSKYVDAFFGSDYKSVFVLMNGSDGAGAYCVIWIFRKNGEHLYMLPTYDELYFNFN